MPAIAYDSTILPGELTPELDQLYTNYVTELLDNPEIPSLQQVVQMYRLCPINRIAIELKAMRAVQAFGKYKHPDSQQVLTSTGRQTLTEWVNSNWTTMQGNFPNVIGKMFRQAYGIGHSVGEIIYSANIPGHYGEWRLWKIKILNPFRYVFAGLHGEWDRIIYRSSYQAHYPVTRRKLIHIYLPSIEDPENPLGDGQGTRGYNYYFARKQALKNWNRQLAKGVKGQTVVKGSSADKVPVTDKDGKVMLDERGNPITTSALKQATKNFALAEDGDVVGIDKSIEVQHIPGISGTGADYNLALKAYIDDIFMCYGIGKTIFGEGAGSLGQSGLNAGHRLTLDTQIEGMIEVGREQIIEQIVRDLLNVNFGIKHQDDYGNFEPDKYLSPEQSGLRVTNIMSGMLQGIISPNDLEAINRVRIDCGLSPIHSEEYNQALINALMQQQQQQPSYEAEA